MSHTHQLATFWPQIFGVCAVLANIALGIGIKRDPKAELPLTWTAVALTVLAASILFQSPRHLRSAATATPNTVFYPSTLPPSRTIPSALRYRNL